MRPTLMGSEVGFRGKLTIATVSTALNREYVWLFLGCSMSNSAPGWSIVQQVIHINTGVAGGWRHVWLLMFSGMSFRMQGRKDDSTFGGVNMYPGSCGAGSVETSEGNGAMKRECCTLLYSD